MTPAVNIRHPSNRFEPHAVNHYERLKVTQDAPPEVIRAAYRALANRLQAHPPSPGAAADAAQEEMMGLNAYMVRHALNRALVFAERTGLLQELVDERCFSMVDVRDNRDVAHFHVCDL